MSEESAGSIADRTIGNYLDTLGASEPAPGGGSASGVVGALASALGQMALSLTDIDGSEHADELRTAKDTLNALGERYLELAQEDESVYLGYLGAAALPKSTDEEKSIRRVAMQDALKKAAGVPMAMCEASADLGEALAPVQEFGNRNLRSDAKVAAIFARACFEGSRVLVEANLTMIKDADWVADVSTQLDELAGRVSSRSVS